MKLEKIADVIVKLTRPEIQQDGEARLAINDLGRELKVEPRLMKQVLEDQMPMIWGKLPLGWMIGMHADGDSLLLSKRKER